MAMPVDVAFAAVDESSPRYDGWRVTAVCFVVAMFCWGFGLYSHGIYLAELQRLFGWSTSLISGATTAYYLLTASLVVFISDAIVQLGPRRVFLLGTCCLGSAVTLLAFIVAPWQLYLVYLIMAGDRPRCTSVRSPTFLACGSIAGAGSRSAWRSTARAPAASSSHRPSSSR